MPAVVSCKNLQTQDLGNLKSRHKMLSAIMQLMVGTLHVTLVAVSCTVFDCYLCTLDTAVEMIAEALLSSIQQTCRV